MNDETDRFLGHCSRPDWVARCVQSYGRQGPVEASSRRLGEFLPTKAEDSRFRRPVSLSGGCVPGGPITQRRAVKHLTTPGRESAYGSMPLKRSFTLVAAGR